MRRANVSCFTLRWALVSALGFAVFALGSFGYVFFTATNSGDARIDATTLRQVAVVANGSTRDAASRVDALLATDEHRTRFAALFDATGRRIAGNLSALPANLSPDGHVRETTGVRVDDRGRKIETMRVAARRLADGRIVAIGNDLDERDQARDDLMRAILIGLLPAIAIAIAFGAAFGIASQRRLRSIDVAIERIASGDFRGRLPVASGRGETDRIALGVNRMLDAIESLYEDLRGIGDDIAHDLRTPLGRIRAQLERSRETVRTVGDFQAAVDRAIVGLDQALALIVAILRIGQLEYRARRSEFARVDLHALVRDGVDLYAPIAEDARVDLRVDRNASAATIDGDRDLLFEALANLLDNAIKFTPPGGHVVVSARTENRTPCLVVADDGPGIAESERATIFQRFTRGDKSRNVVGNGLGLSLVAAIARLHGARVSIETRTPGCALRLAFEGDTVATEHAVPQKARWRAKRRPASGYRPVGPSGSNSL